MNLSPWIVYFWGIADNIRETAIFLSIILGISLVVALVIRIVAITDLEEETLRGADKWLKRAGGTVVVCLLLSAFVPSSRTVAVMVIAPAIANSKAVQQDLPELYSVAVEALKATMKSSATNK